MLKIFTTILTVFILILLVVSWWGGQFDRVGISKEMVGPYHLVYREYYGSYSGYRLLVKNVALHLNEKKNIKTEMGFAIFYNNPTEIPAKKLHCSAGVVVDTEVTVDKPLKYAEFSGTEAIVGVFPVRSYFSYIVGSYKVRATLHNYCDKNGYTIIEPILEIYDLSSRKIRYIAPIGRTTSPAPAFGL
jgi:effector-binding domain-containing protein